MNIGSFFRKKKDSTIIDFSGMQRRTASSKEKTLNTASSGSANESPFGFLGNIASASATDNTDITDALIRPILISKDGKQKLRGILRDLKGKIDSAHDRVYKLSDRLALIEKKIERLERRSGM